MREKLPEGFQRSEFLLAHGVVDMIVHRQDLKARIAAVLGLLTGGRAPTGSAAGGAAPAPVSAPAESVR